MLYVTIVLSGLASHCAGSVVSLCPVLNCSSKYGKKLWLVSGRYIDDAVKTIILMTSEMCLGYATKCCTPTTTVPSMTSTCPLWLISHTSIVVIVFAVLCFVICGLDVLNVTMLKCWMMKWFLLIEIDWTRCRIYSKYSQSINVCHDSSQWLKNSDIWAEVSDLLRLFIVCTGCSVVQVLWLFLESWWNAFWTHL